MVTKKRGVPWVCKFHKSVGSQRGSSAPRNTPANPNRQSTCRNGGARRLRTPCPHTLTTSPYKFGMSSGNAPLQHDRCRRRPRGETFAHSLYRNRTPHSHRHLSLATPHHRHRRDLLDRPLLSLPASQPTRFQSHLSKLSRASLFLRAICYHVPS